MKANGNEMKAIYMSLRLKEAVLCELINDTKTQIETIHSLREKFEKAINDGPEKE